MNRGTLALLALLALGIGWLVWSSRATDEPPTAPHAPGTSAAAPEVQKPAPTAAPAPASSTTPIETESTPLNDASPASETATADPTEILVRGRVLNEKDEPVAGASLRWLDARGGEQFAAIEKGDYALPGMQAGRYLVTLVGTGWRREQIDVELPARPAAQQRDFRAQANLRVLIRVLDASGAALIPKEVSGYEHPEYKLRVYALTHATGGQLDPELLRYKLSSDCARFQTRWELKSDCADCLGALELFDDPPLYVSLVLGTTVLATRKLESVPSELVFTLSADDLRSKLAALRVRLIHPDGKPVSDSGMVMLQADDVRTRNLDADGRAEFKGMLPGGYSLSLICAGNSRQERELVLEAGQVLDLGDVTIAPASAPNQVVRFTFPSDEQSSVMFGLQPVLPGRPLELIGTFSGSSYGTGGRNPMEISFPGPGTYELLVTGVGDSRGGNSLRLGARPQRVVLGDAPAGEIAVPIVTTSDVCLRPLGDARGVSRWLVSTVDGLPCRRVRIEGRAPTRIELVPGGYAIARIDPETRTLRESQSFSVGSSFLEVELKP